MKKELSSAALADDLTAALRELESLLQSKNGRDQSSELAESQPVITLRQQVANLLAPFGMTPIPTVSPNTLYKARLEQVFSTEKIQDFLSLLQIVHRSTAVSAVVESSQPNLLQMHMHNELASQIQKLLAQPAFIHLRKLPAALYLRAVGHSFASVPQGDEMMSENEEGVHMFSPFVFSLSPTGDAEEYPFLHISNSTTGWIGNVLATESGTCANHFYQSTLPGITDQLPAEQLFDGVRYGTASVRELLMSFLPGQNTEMLLASRYRVHTTNGCLALEPPEIESWDVNTVRRQVGMKLLWQLARGRVPPVQYR